MWVRSAIELILNALHLQGDEKWRNNLASDDHYPRFQFKHDEANLADEVGDESKNNGELACEAPDASEYSSRFTTGPLPKPVFHTLIKDSILFVHLLKFTSCCYTSNPLLIRNPGKV